MLKVKTSMGITNNFLILKPNSVMKEYWTTADNRRLDVDEITDVNHLRNIVKMLMRRDRSTVEKYNALVDKYNVLNGRSFVSLNGDMAQSHFDDCQNDWMDPNLNLP